jgi:hypothetical protein
MCFLTQNTHVRPFRPFFKEKIATIRPFFKEKID